MIHEFAKPLFDAFYNSGEEIYLVGGAVRDHWIYFIKKARQIELNGTILEEPDIKDLDFATSATPEKSKKILRKNKFKYYPLGLNFGTVGSKIGDVPVEITTYRCKESYVRGSRKPVVQFGTSLIEDLKRRDFTINAMAMDRAGNIYDPFHANMSYLAGKLIVPNVSPAETFQDDPLRMLRGFRFESKLNLRLDDMEKLAIRDCKDMIHNISKERIFSEFDKILLTDKPGQAIRDMHELGILCVIFPEIASLLENNYFLFHKTIDFVDNCPPISAVRWAALFSAVHREKVKNENIHKEAAETFQAISERLKTNKAFRKHVSFLILHQQKLMTLVDVSCDINISAGAMRRFIYESQDHLETLYSLSLARALTFSRSPELVQKLTFAKMKIDSLNEEQPITGLALPKGLGKEISKFLSIPDGSHLGNILRRLKHELISGELDKHSDFLAAAKRIHEKMFNNSVR